MIKMFTYFLTMVRQAFLFLFLLHFQAALFAQCETNLEGLVIINEVGNFGQRVPISEEPFYKHLYQEYIELLVIGSSDNGFAPIDINNWIIDDNNIASIDVGNEPGHLRFQNLPPIPPGSIILIYNDESPYDGIDKFKDGLPNEDGVYQIGFSSKYLFKNEGAPNHEYAGYDNYVQDDRPKIWKEYVPLRDFGDLVQIRNEEGGLIHSVGWHNSNFYFDYDQSHYSVIKSGDYGVGSYSLLGEDWQNQNSFTKFKTGTPGSPNSGSNANFINQVKNGGFNNGAISIECDLNLNIDNGTFFPILNVQNGINDLNITVFKGNEIVQTFDIGEYGIYPLDLFEEGEYSIVATHQVYQCQETCNLTLPSQNEETVDLCSTDCYTILTNSSSTGGQVNSDCFFISTGGEIISTNEESHEICEIDGNITVTQYDQNENGDITAINTYNLITEPESIYIESSQGILCDGELVLTLISNEIDIVSYEWSANNETSSSISISEPGEYIVSATDNGGCVHVREKIVYGDDNLHEYLISEGYYPLLIDETISVNTINNPPSDIIEESAEIVISIDGTIVNVNNEINEFVDRVSSHFTDFSVKIWQIEDCQPVLFSENKGDAISRNVETDKYLEIDIISTKNHVNGNDNLYVKKTSIVNNSLTSDPGTIYIANLTDNISVTAYEEQLDYFLNRAKIQGLNFEINPVPQTLEAADAVVIIDDTKWDIVYHIFTHNILCNVVHLPNTHEVLLQFSEENNLYTAETGDYEPLILIDYATFANVQSQWDNDGINSLNDNRLAGFLSLHAMGHFSGFDHWDLYPQKRPSYEGEEPCGFMARGSAFYVPIYGGSEISYTICGLKSYLTDPAIPDYNTFEKVIDLTILSQPFIIQGIKTRFGL